MAIYKAIVSPDGKGIGHATPHKLEDYLKYKQDEDGNFLKDKNGEKISRASAVTALNADSENFSRGCIELSNIRNTCRDYDSLKYKHYVQGFPPEDCGKMTEEKCHELGVELAKTFWKDFPVLVVTHCDQKVDGTEDYHWHNHFIVYNCAVTDGHKIDTSKNALWEQKVFVAMQAGGNGLTEKGLILKDGYIMESTMPEKIDMSERQIQKRGQKEFGQQPFLTQKAELRLAVRNAVLHSNNYTEFRRYLDETYGVKVKESRGAVAFLHPERAEQARSWIRGRSLGAIYTKEAILNGIEKSKNRRNHIGGSVSTEDTSRITGSIAQNYDADLARAKQLQEYFRFLYAEDGESASSFEPFSEGSYRGSKAKQNIEGSDNGNAPTNENGDIRRGGKHI